MLLTQEVLLYLAVIFLLGGLVKGAVGFGLPTIGIGLDNMRTHGCLNEATESRIASVKPNKKPPR